MTAEEARALTNKTIENKIEFKIAYDLIDREIKTEALLGHTNCQVSLDGMDLSWDEIEQRRQGIYDHYTTRGYKVDMLGYHRATGLDHFVFDWYKKS